MCWSMYIYFFSMGKEKEKDKTNLQMWAPNEQTQHLPRISSPKLSVCAFLFWFLNFDFDFLPVLWCIWRMQQMAFREFSKENRHILRKKGYKSPDLDSVFL